MGILLSSIILISGIVLLFLNLKTSKKLLIFMAVFLLLYKTIEYTIYGLHLEQAKTPIEYSTLTYFLLSIYVIFGIKQLKSIAAFAGLISGLGYLIVFVFLYDEYVVNQGIFSTIMAYINHSICFLGSLIIMKSEPINQIDKKKILIFTTIYIIYVIIISNFITYSSSYIFILMLLNGKILEKFISYRSISTIDHLAYFLLIFLFYKYLIKIFIWISKLIYNIRKGQKHEYTV